MDQQEINKTNNPGNAMDSSEKVVSNDSKLKQDFPGFPHNPASEDIVKGNKDGSTGLSNESDTTVTGSESVKGERPTEQENELKSGSDRGLNMHDDNLPKGPGG